MQLSTYELKYCERCGSLLLRRSASAETYCEPCEQMLANYSLRNHAGRANLLLYKPRPNQSRLRYCPLIHRRNCRWGCCNEAPPLIAFAVSAFRRRSVSFRRVQ
jgi:hypothetical protein